jgi:hypothetical protein
VFTTCWRVTDEESTNRGFPSATHCLTRYQMKLRTTPLATLTDLGIYSGATKKERVGTFTQRIPLDSDKDNPYSTCELSSPGRKLFGGVCGLTTSGQPHSVQFSSLPTTPRTRNGTRQPLSLFHFLFITDTLVMFSSSFFVFHTALSLVGMAFAVVVSPGVQIVSPKSISEFAPYTQFARAAYCPLYKLNKWKCGGQPLNSCHQSCCAHDFAEACKALPTFQLSLLAGDGNGIQTCTVYSLLSCGQHITRFLSLIPPCIFLRFCGILASTKNRHRCARRH